MHVDDFFSIKLSDSHVYIISTSRENSHNIILKSFQALLLLWRSQRQQRGLFFLDFSLPFFFFGLYCYRWTCNYIILLLCPLQTQILSHYNVSEWLKRSQSLIRKSLSLITELFYRSLFPGSKSDVREIHFVVVFRFLKPLNVISTHCKIYH